MKKPAVPPTGMPQIAMTWKMALEDSVGPNRQPELMDLVERGVVPAVDTRTDRERIAAWIGHAKAVGAVRIVG